MTNSKETKNKYKCCQWNSLNALRNMQFLRISYVILVIVPIIASIKTTPIGQFFNELPITLRLGYFASLVLSIAHMLYQGFCPQIIKRFESPNDLYRGLLEIKSLQEQFLKNDQAFEFDIKHCRNSFKTSNLDKPIIRLVCWVLFMVGLVLALIIAIERSLVVLFAG